MDKLQLREFMSSKPIPIKTAINLHTEKNGRGVFLLREKAKEERRKPNVKPRKLKKTYEEFNDERQSKRQKMGDTLMPDAHKPLEKIFSQTQAFSQSQGQDGDDFSSL